MGKPVTVDSEDLEALLFATGSIKAIEAALRQRADDPQVIAIEWRAAIRNPPPLQPVTTAERELMQTIAAGEWSGAVAIGVGATGRDPILELRSLRQKGYVEVGAVHEMIRWGDSPAAGRDLGRMVARLTPRGLAALELLEPGEYHRALLECAKRTGCSRLVRTGDGCCEGEIHGGACSNWNALGCECARRP